MVEVSIANSECHLEILGWDKLWAFKSRFDIPLQHIQDARIDSGISWTFWKGIRAPGTSLPGVIVAGTYYYGGKRLFWDVHNIKKAVVIDLIDEKYNQLVVEVRDPEAVVRQIQEAIRPEQAA